jgi:multisubunit Na+/H+ antiporter MnhG subunit
MIFVTVTTPIGLIILVRAAMLREQSRHKSAWRDQHPKQG